MTSNDDFEARFEQRLQGFASQVGSPADPEVVARAVAARTTSVVSRPGRAPNRPIRTVYGRPRPLLLVAIMVLGSIGTALVAGGLTGAPAVGPTTSPSQLAIATVPVSVAPPVQPSPLPPGRLGRLAYGLNGSIYVATSDGTKPVRVAKGVFDQGGVGPDGCGSFWGEGTIWSPDGRHFAYRSAWDNAVCHGTPGAGNVYISDPAGKVVATFPGIGWLISWSPDSTRVATWVGATSADLGKMIAIYGLDGVRQELLSVPAGCQEPGDFDPVWSANGDSLDVVGCEVPLDGRTPTRVSPIDPRSLPRLAFSPDGTRIAYTKTGQLFVAAADGSQSRALVSTGDYSGRWAPTSDRIAIVVTGPSGQDELSLIGIADGIGTSLAKSSGTGHLAVIGFAPEGDQILFSKSDSNFAGTGLWSVRVDGTNAQRLIAGTNWGDWQWLPTTS